MKNWRTKALTVWVGTLILIWSPIITYMHSTDKAKQVKVIEKTKIINPVTIKDKVIEQDVETTFHEYIVVTRNGIVSPNGVIHSAKCKCKSI